MGNSKSDDLFSGPLFALVTGGSQGLGRSIVIDLAARVAQKSVIAISARSKAGLQETSKLAKEHRRKICHDEDIEIVCVSSDLCNFKDVESLVDCCVAGQNNKRFSSSLLIHNAATLGDLEKDMCDFRDLKEVVDYYNLNLTNLPTITGKFMEWINAGDHHPQIVVVNVSSLLALQARAGFSLYASGKAARNILFQVLAMENPEVKVLNYAPGPLYNHMTEDIIRLSIKHKISDMFVKMKAEGMFLTCEDSAAKLLELLRKNEYETGQHIDAFDC